MTPKVTINGKPLKPKLSLDMSPRLSKEQVRHMEKTLAEIAHRMISEKRLKKA